MKNIGKFLGRGLIVIAILALIAGAGGMYYFKSYLPNTVAPQSFPKIDGDIKLEGLDGPVDVYRDHMGVPHIYASTIHDLFFTQGYVHAQDRFWQMDAWRHIGSGTLSEMFGKGQVDTDAFLRTLSWKQIAEKEWGQFGPESKAILQAYTDGVNAYLKDHDNNALSLEYAVLGLLSPDYKITKWTPVNSLTWGKAMAWDLRGNISEEIERSILLKALTPEQVADLFPDYPNDHPVIVNNLGNGTSSAAPAAAQAVTLDIPEQTLSTLQQNVSLLDAVLGPQGDGIGSNSWAISGKLTATGIPLLANDPHLSIQMPSIWYQMDMQCKPKSDKCLYSMGGFTFAGVPGVIIGHNDHIAWGFTNLGPDVMDLFIEKVNPEDPNQYEVNGKWADFETRKETINIVGGDPVEIIVRSTRHGPVISESYGPLKNEGNPKDKRFVPFKDRAGLDLPPNYVIALAWTALNPSTPFEAIWGFNKAQNWYDFRVAARNFHVPAQNLLYADTQGNIGYQMPGDIPIRKKGDGTIPVPGWTDDYEWRGFIPFDELPYTFNPAEGYIATANNQVPPPGYKYNITKDWDYGFRANRIVDMIKNSPGKIDIPYIQKMQGDSQNPNAETLVPVLLTIKLDAQLSAIRDQLLSTWDDQNNANSAPAALFEVFWKHLLENTFRDDLPESFWNSPISSSFWRESRWYEVFRKLVNQPESPWWDNKATANRVETRDDIFAQSFSQAVSELKDKLGSDPAKWQWGDLHTATFKNQTLGKSGISLIDDLFNRGPFSTSGGSSIVNATGWLPNKNFEVDWLPSMRMIVDLGNLNNSLTVHTTGQSGHAYNKHYDDLSKMWASIQYYPMYWDENAAIADAEGQLRLTP